MILKAWEEPVQVPSTGVTDTVDTCLEETFWPVKEAILPDPLADRPVAVFVFVQLYTVPACPPEKVMAGIASPPQTVISDTTLTEGTGFTVSIKAIRLLSHFVTGS